MKKTAIPFFATYPAVNEFYFTTDGQAFFNAKDAENHAQSLGKSNEAVECVKREEETVSENEVTEAEILKAKEDADFAAALAAEEAKKEVANTKK